MHKNTWSILKNWNYYILKLHIPLNRLFFTQCQEYASNVVIYYVRPKTLPKAVYIVLKKRITKQIEEKRNTKLQVIYARMILCDYVSELRIA